MRIRLDSFSGVAPGINPAKLPPGMAQTATNCDFSHNDLRPLRAMSTILDLGNTDLRTLYYFDGSWRAWEQDVDIARSPIANESGRTIAFGSIAAGPEEWDENSAISGLAPTGYLLGLPAPTTAPTLTAGSGGGCDVADQTSVAILNTFLRRWSDVDEEGPPSETAIIDLCEGQTVTVDSFAAVPAGDYNITHRRIYGAIAGVYLFIAEIPVATTTYDWVFSADGLGTDELPSDGWDAPPSSAQGLVIKANGVGVAFDGNTLLISEPYQLHAWPLEYQLSTDYPIVALAAIGDVVAVMTSGPTQYLLLGSDPASMELRRLENYQACAAKLSAVDMGAFGIYAGTDGLIAVSPSGETRNITGAWYTPELWRDLIYPASVRGYNWQGRYVAFYFRVTGYTYMTVEDSVESLFDEYEGTPGGFVYDPKVIGLTLMDFAADGGRTLGEAVVNGGVTTIQAGLLAVLDDGVVKKFADEDAAYLSATWKSPITRTPNAINFGAAQVIADNYPLTWKLYADGVLKHTQTVTDGNPFRLPGGYRGMDWEQEFTVTNGPVRYSVLAETIRELAAE
jgi:hypothetical protein